MIETFSCISFFHKNIIEVKSLVEATLEELSPDKAQRACGRKSALYVTFILFHKWYRDPKDLLK